MMESPSAITKLSFRWSSWNREFSALSPHIWSELTSCRGHPSPRVVHTLANLPPRHILHNSGLLFQIFIPFFHKSTNKSKDKTRFKKKKSGKLYIIKKLVLQHPIPHRKNQKKKKADMSLTYLSSSSAWSMGSIALRAAYFSSLSSLKISTWWHHNCKKLG